jgi:hypothetical protein
MPFGLSKATVLGAAGSGGDGGAIQWIAGMNGSGSSASLLFDNIPQDYKHLRIVMSNIHQTAANSNTYFIVNGNSTPVKMADYWTDSSTVYNFWRQQSQSNQWPYHNTPGTSTTNVGSHIVDWMGYTSNGADGTSTYSGYAQSFMMASYGHDNSTVDLHTGGVVWQPSTTGNPAAITSIEIYTYHSSDHWLAETRVDMYGIGTAAA